MASPQFDIAGNPSLQRVITRTAPLASLPLQILLVLDRDYISWLFFFSTLVFGVFKVWKFQLPHYIFERELIVLVIF